MYKLSGLFLSGLGLAVMLYFNLFSLKAPNPMFALIGSVIFAIGLGSIYIGRYKNKPDKNGQA
ncbi:hypothetical protein [Aliidiomarina sedimenti]|uniref:hypothetical protein n=1 Tax=Aliidiomarina sedimenti TaxID=1933879 RepID=UPI000F87FA6A|nr:hypothetical protein [Aliidiomarina sedimenti]